MNVTKRHYYKYFNPKTGTTYEHQCERSMTLQKQWSLKDAGFELVQEIYWDPVAWKRLKNFSKNS